ncbi:MAG TPA: ABC transporter substrate-binding protein [Candidatus Methylomirabilis sp.]|nr:ABC transporter substrate-binding protein [Candidatus Methylomirabilis sp.]
MRRVLWLIGMGFLLVLAAGIQRPPMAAAAAPTKVVIGLNSDVRSFDPINTLDTTTDRVISHIYEYLYTRDRSMKLAPLLAESARTLDDLNWEIKLRKNVKFSDGEPFNAETVKANIEYIVKKENNAARRVRIDLVKSATVVDEHTVRITTEKPFPTLLEGLTEIYMVPIRAIKEGPKSLTEKPIGTGPYKLQEWKREQSITLVRNDNYWGPKPQIPVVEVRIIPDVAARISALLAGEVHLIPDVPPQSIDQVNKSGIAETRSVAGRRVIFVAFNTLQPGPLQDVRVRQAINHAVDVDKIIRTIMEGNAKRMVGPLPVINRHLDPKLKPYSVDLAKAKALLQQAGYTGAPITLHTPNGRYLKDNEAAQAIAEQLTQAGINVKLQTDEWGTLLDLVKSGKVDGMYFFGRSDTTLDGSMLRDWFHTGSTWVTYSDKKIDAAIENALPIVNSEKRRHAFSELQVQIQEQAPWIFLWSQFDIYGVNKKLQWEPRGDEQFAVGAAAWK